MSWSKVGLHVTLKKEGWSSIHCTHYFLDSHAMGGPWPQWVNVPNGPTAAPRPLICKTEKHRRAPHPAIFYRWLVCFCPFFFDTNHDETLKKRTHSSGWPTSPQPSSGWPTSPQPSGSWQRRKLLKRSIWRQKLPMLVPWC